MPMIQLHHAHLFYAQYQPKDARQTLLLIHGAGGSHLTWPAALRRLPKTAVYALDLAGHGRSKPPGRSTIEAYIQDVLDFIGALELQNVVVLGHSMGGAIAQMIGLSQSPAVAGLILLGTGAKLRVSPAILEAIQTNFENAVDMLNQYYWGGQQDPDIVTTNRRSMLACPADVMLNDFLACDQFDLRTRLAEITLPTLVISASTDQMTPPKFGQFLVEHLPQAEFALIEQAGHMMMLEFPEQVAQLAGDFMAKISVGS
ncbi:MAG: alpha/beta hydrolase [Ardenticatenaceae bacterium]|nr:MAG: alpha/beta hydrolase [Ardenticatenaceae bacterium]